MSPPQLESRVRELVEEASKLDAAEEDGERPFAPKYAAREKLEEALAAVRKARDDPPPEWAEALRVLEAALLYKLAKNLVNTEERASGAERVGKALEVLREGQVTMASDPDPHVSPVSVHVYAAVLSYKGFIAESRGFSDEARLHLHAAERVYQLYKEQFLDKTPWDFRFLLRRLTGDAEELREVTEVPSLAQDSQVFLREKLFRSLESLHTHTLYFLAQVYTNLGQKATGAKYCEETLKRQLEWRDEFSPASWALNATTLSQFYLGTKPENFPQARHCLAAATALLRPELEALPAELRSLEPDSQEDPTPEQTAAETLVQTEADLGRCWAKYGVALMEASQAWLLDSERPSEEAAKALSLQDVEVSLDEEAQLSTRFPVDGVAEVEAEIPAAFVTTFPMAKKVYARVNAWLDVAKEFYGVDNRATDFVEIAQDRSRLYKAMAFHYPKPEDKAKLHKRRLDLMPQTLDGFNTQAYMSICRQMMFELGETANEMVSLKVEAMEARNTGGDRVPSDHEVVKINVLCDTGIRHFNTFLESYRDGDGRLPDKYPADAVRPVIIARFYIARLFGKKLSGDPRDKIAWGRCSLECYKWINTYVEEADPEALEVVRPEFEAAGEMHRLLPVKLARMEEALLG